MKGVRVANLALPVIYMLGAFILFSIPGEMVPLRNVSVFDIKITDTLHAPAYVVLFILLFKTLQKLHLGQKNCYIYAVSISLIYNGFQETFQYFAPGRSASLIDILLNVSGVGVGVILVSKWKGRQLKYKPIKNLAFEFINPLKKLSLLRVKKEK